MRHCVEIPGLNQRLVHNKTLCKKRTTLKKFAAFRPQVTSIAHNLKSFTPSSCSNNLETFLDDIFMFVAQIQVLRVLF